jgi:hypothetical protein
VDPTTLPPPPLVVVRLQGPFSFVDMGKDKREETSPRQTQKVREKDTRTQEKRRGEGRSVGLCLPHRPLLLLLLICFCLSVCLGLSLPFEELLSCLLSLQKKVFVSSLTICNSPPQTPKKKKEKKRVASKVLLTV